MQRMNSRCGALAAGSMAAVVTLGSPPALPAEATPNSLAFDAQQYTTLNITIDGAPMQVRRYHVVYVTRPVPMAAQQPDRGMNPGSVNAPGAARPPAAPAAPFDPYGHQSMYIYVPKSAYDDARTAIILQVGNSGWFASPAMDRILAGGEFSGTGDTDSTGAALKAGYLVVNAGTRSRGLKGADGNWAGKAPAVVVDAKAAVRYLRLNDSVMPGSAERIVITGTSGGGGLSVAVAASGNSPDYYPYLAEIGAAGIAANGRSTLRDDVFATVAYCPITDLGHADMAYEWQFGALRTDANTVRGKYPVEMQRASASLAAAYPAYLASLRLKREDGSPLTASNLQQAILAQVKKGAEAAIARGEPVPAIGDELSFRMRNQTFKVRNQWLTVESGKVTNIDYTKYLQFVADATALKSVPAFDASANTGNPGVSGENTLFGSRTVGYSNFTDYSWDHNEVPGDGSGTDDTGKSWRAFVTSSGQELQKQIRMVSPMTYLNSSADSAPYWYVRHGIADRDTSFAIELALYYGIRNDPSVKDVNFQLAWLQGHAGNYDVQEAYAWLAQMLAGAGDPDQKP